MKHNVAVLGAGMVGIACALELQRRGASVTLIDRKAPGMETSYGNAGVMARSSLMPFNHPGLWRALPRLLGNRSAQLRVNPMFLARNPGWALGFLARARRSVFERTTQALDALIRLSMAEHRRLLAEAGSLHRLRENGWMLLYRSDQTYEGSRLLRQTLERFGIANQALDAHGLADIEPDLAPVFSHALWIKDAASVDSPGRVAQAYAALFAARGGAIRCRHIERLAPDGSGSWNIFDADGATLIADSVVIALGPWSKSFLGPLGISVPMAFERGYHMHYGVQANVALRRPVYDVAGAYVLSPMEGGLRLTTGVELAGRDAPPNMAQLEMAERSAREAFALGERLDASAWMGSRPTLPDSRPMIGELPGHAGLWLAFGHQHIGFCTGPGTAAVLGAMMFNEPVTIDPLPFAPGRFLG